MNRKCKDCGNVYEGCKYCIECDSENTEVILPIYVNVYLTNLVCGGSEEGGWYYTCGEPIESVSVDSEKEADELIVRYREKYSNEGRLPMSSVLSNGEYRIQTEGHFAEKFPKQKPIYE